MTQKRKTKKKSRSGEGFIGRLFAQTKLPAHVTEEQDWYLDTPDVRLTRVFTIVLVLHVVAVGGILAFKMVEKASTPAAVATAASPQDGEPAPEIKSQADPKEAAPPKPKGASPAGPAAEPGPKPASKNRAGLVMDHPSAPGYRQYRVAAGDSLVSIAREMNVSAAELRELNHLSEDTRLMPGKWLNIPGPNRPPAKGGAKKKATTATPGAVAKAGSKPATEKSSVRPIGKISNAGETPGAVSSSTYEVQKGDTFFGIARRFGLDYKDLMASNGIESPEGLQAGMTLKIPEN